MSAAAKRLAALDSMPALTLCGETETMLTTLVNVMNEETTLLRAGRYKQANELTARKTQLSQDYVVLARAVQRQHQRLSEEAPEALARLQVCHEQLATQMAENLRIIATAKTLAENLLTDLAEAVGQQDRTKTYNQTGYVGMPKSASAKGIAINRAM